MKQVNELFTIEQLPKIAEGIITNNPNKRILAFYGKMGAGKTTLIKAICKYMQVEGNVDSPTFSIVNQYHTKNNQTLFHFDFYRLEKLEELFDIGYEDYFYSNNYCFLEWPEKIEPLLPDDTLNIYLDEVATLQSARQIRYNSEI